MKYAPLIIMFSTLLLLGCTATPSPQGGSQTQTNTPEIVKVGVIAPLSGPIPSAGEDVVHTFRFTTDNFNNSQNKYKIDLIVEDGKCNGKDATSAAQKLIQVDDVDAILGGVCSSETIAASKITVPAGKVLLSAVSSAPEISNNKDLVYRYYSDNNQSKTLLQYAKRHDIKKFSIIYQNNDYGVGLANQLQEGIGKENVVSLYKFNGEETDFSLIAKSLAKEKNDIDGIVYIPSSDSSIINIVKALGKEGLLESFKNNIFTSEVGYTIGAQKELGNLMEGIRTTQLPTPEELGPESLNFLTDFKKIYEVKFSDTFISVYKDSFDLLTNAITDPKFGPSKINAYIKTITQENPMSGLIGTYYFSGADVVGTSFIMKEVKNGTLVPVE